jgi:hypothetical protein
MLQNHGLMTLTSAAPPAGTLDLSVRGRVCGLSHPNPTEARRRSGQG